MKSGIVCIDRKLLDILFASHSYFTLELDQQIIHAEDIKMKAWIEGRKKCAIKTYNQGAKI